MRDEGGAGILERLAAGDVVIVAVAVDHVADRRLGDLADFRDVGRHRLRPALADRVGGDHALGRDDEHRLMPLIAKDVDPVGAVDLGGREQRRGGRRRGCGGRSRLRQCHCGERGRDRGAQQSGAKMKTMRHRQSSMIFLCATGSAAAHPVRPLMGDRLASPAAKPNAMPCARSRKRLMGTAWNDRDQVLPPSTPAIFQALPSLT